MKARLALIAAVARNRVIGAGGALPWRLSGDLKFFKRTTLGKPVIMGRKTWDSIGGKPLPGRPNIVLTRELGWTAAGALVCHGLEGALSEAGALAAASGAEEVLVIGGEALFADALPLADRIWLTEVEAEPDGDALFPAFDRTVWQETEIERAAAAGPDSPAYRIVRLDRLR